MKHFIIALGFIISMALPALAVPSLISYQGKLTNASGTAITTSTSVTFKIYNVSSGGTPLWSEAQTLTPDNGVINAILGSVTSITLPFTAQYWLGITAGGDAEMTPRIKLTTSPYAFNAKTADTAVTDEDWTISGANVYRSSGNVGIGTSTPAQALDVVGTVQATSFLGSGASLTGISGDTDWTISGANIYRASGNVGIATTTPAGLLDVNGGTFTVLSTGNVGIGTTTPGFKLDVYGNIKLGPRNSSQASISASLVAPLSSRRQSWWTRTR